MIFRDGLAEAARVLELFRTDEASLRACEAFAEMLAESFRNGGKAMAAGNGGSMADALHFAEEFTGRFRNDRAPLPAMALGESTHLTCVSNDYGFDYVFSRLVQAFLKPGDVLLLLSPSGNSTNLVGAAEAARERGVKVVGFLGRGGGRLAPLCDLVVMAPGDTSDRIQEVHMTVLHLAIEAVERALGL
jgi:D-sedoheptulose 7-phosphate isomerase